MSRIGRSIEEIIVMRQLEGNSETKMSSTLGNLRNLPSSAKTKVRPKGKTVMPQTENERKIVENLMEHSRMLQYRLQELESRLITSENNAENLRYELDMAQQREADLISNMRFGSRMVSRMPTPLLSSQGRLISRGALNVGSGGEFTPIPTPITNKPVTHHVIPASPTAAKKSRSKSGVPFSPGSRVGTVFSETMTDTVTGMEEHIAELRHLFRPSDPLEERNWASIKIQACIRTFIVRRRYTKYCTAVNSWRLGRSSTMMPVIEMGLTNASRIDLGMSTMQMKRQRGLVDAVFNRWQHICKQSAPFRRSMLVAAEEKFQAIRFKLMLRIFMAFKNGTIGNESHKHIRKERRQLVESVRQSIYEQMQLDGRQNMLIPESDVQRAVYREIVKATIAKREYRNKGLVLKSFKGLYELSVKNKKTAYACAFNKYAGRCFYAWSDWTYAVGSGLERKRWAGPRRYEVRYNQKLVEHFSKNRMKKMTLYPWIRFTQLSKAINKRFMVKRTNFMRFVISEWHRVTEKHKALRQLTYNNWSGYAYFIMSTPFHAWKDFASTASVRRMQQNSLVNAYVRWKTRQKHIHILRLWRHQALYGGIEGMYSRTTISKSLGEQKGVCAALQKMITKQTLELEECREMVHKETLARKKMEDLVSDRDSEIEKLKATNHHVDMELRRLYGIIEAMARINPSQVQLIRSMQPDFEFQLRKIQPSLAAASADELFATGDNDDNVGAAPDDQATNVHTPMADSGSNTPKWPTTTTAGSANCTVNPSAVSAMRENEFPSQANALALEAFKPINMPEQGRFISSDDKRLLARVKWLLKRLVIEDPVKEPEEKITTPMNDDEEAEGELEDNDDNDDSDDNDADHGLFTPREEANERTVRELLADAADGKETIFLLNMLSFIRDGNPKCLSDVDGRAWAEELLSTMDREDELPKFDESTTEMFRSHSASGTKPFDLESWRAVLVHLRTNYPVGMAARIANAKFNDDLNEAQTALLARVKTMQSDLKEVIEFKRKKISHSRFGKTLQSSLLLRDDGGEGAMSATVFTLNEDEEEDDDEERQEESEKLNVYADLILTSPNKEKVTADAVKGDDDSVDLSTYDDFSLTGDPATAGTRLLSMQQHLTDSINSPSNLGFNIGGGDDCESEGE